MRPAACPACGAIPAVNFRTMWHRGQGLPVFYIFQAERARYVKTKRVWSAAYREISRPCQSQPKANGHARQTRVGAGRAARFFYTFRKSLLLSKPRDVTYRQCKSLRILTDCTSFLIILLVGLIAGWLAGQIVRGTSYGLVADICIG